MGVHNSVELDIFEEGPVKALKAWYRGWRSIAIRNAHVVSDQGYALNIRLLYGAPLGPVDGGFAFEYEGGLYIIPDRFLSVVKGRRG